MTAKNDNEELQNCSVDYWEYFLKYNPTFATYIGDHRYDDELQDISEQSLSKQNDFHKNLLVRLDKIDEASLSTENKLNIMLLKNRVSDRIQLYNFKAHLLPLDHMEGPHLDFPQIIEYHPFNTKKDFENYVARLKAFPQLIDQVIDNLQNGIKHNIISFKKSIEYVIQQVNTFTKFSQEDHPLFAPIKKLDNGFSEQEKEEIQRTIEESITSEVTSAYAKLSRYLNDTYINCCREKEGIWSLPNGGDMYAFLVKHHTTTDLSPEEIHEIGKKEVERISGEIREIMKQTDFSGTVKAFAEHLRGKKELYHKQGEELLDDYRNILSRMDKKLPDYFGRLPKARYGLKKIETYREQTAPAAYYYPPPKDFSRPGYFYVNTYKPEQRPIFEMEALAYHEAIPGHHLQIAIMQELENIPDFRKYEGATAFIEGWALYAEKLSGEMGFYGNVYSEYGRLTFEIWRAVRLVVDTGLHYYRWSRDDAINFCKETTGLEEHEIEVEVDRYIVMPGQALAYKMGEIKILELREKTKKHLGSAFNIKCFHDKLLENGALPLFVLENIVDEWVKSVVV
ncbi:MAG: DUF885 domain-containing protein [Candidatus Kuenenia sp.]|nr:DUF885 domain-containing protein [Candidatus Kuenenia hertensis]